MKRKMLSLLMSVAMICSLVVVSAAAEEVSIVASSTLGDVKDHWAEGAISRWSGYGVVKGDENGRFNPNNNMTVAELATML